MIASANFSANLRKLRTRIRHCRHSPNDFLAFAFTDSEGRRLRQASLHIELQDFLSRQSKALVELPRDHGKSVQMCGRVIWELGVQPALRIKIVCATEELAGQRTRFLRDAIAKNPAVRVVFPKLLPASPWTAAAFTVVRPAETIGPSVAAFGIGAGSTGARADLLICDDIVDVRSLHSRAARDRTRDFFHNNLMNLLEPGGRFWGFCTPWHADDVNAQLKKSRAYSLFRKPVGANLEPVWPEKWPSAALALRREEIGESSFARGYRLLPIDESEVLIRPEWIHFWNDELPRSAFDTVVLSIDPAVGAKATSDATALVVLGRIDGGLRVLAAHARRIAAPQLAEAIDELDRFWQPDAILFESNAAFAGIRELFERHTRFGPRIVGFTQHRKKASRIAALSVPVQNGTVKLRGECGLVDPGQRQLFEELSCFPFAANDDLADATAAGVEHLLGERQPRMW